MSNLISDEYRALNEQLHAQREDYGAHGRKWAGIVQDVCKALKTNKVLDYGCGKGSLRYALPIMEVAMYDPAVPEYSDVPDPRDVVVCTDVLEHIEEEYLTAVLQDVERCTEKAVVFAVNTGPAMKHLPDGRNAHLIQEPYTWWLQRIWTDTTLVLTSFNQTGPAEFMCVWEDQANLTSKMDPAVKLVDEEAAAKLEGEPEAPAEAHV